MKKKNIRFLNMLIIFGFCICTSINVFAIPLPGTDVNGVTGGGSCSLLLNHPAYTKYIKPGMQLVGIIAVVLAVTMFTKDILSAVTASNEDKMKKAQKDAISRIIIAVLILFLPLIIRGVFGLIDLTNISFCGV